MRKHLFVTLLLTCAMPFTGQMLALAAPAPQAQSQGVVTVKGSVLDENDEPVIGASVTPKGQKTGVSTDEFGNFTISVRPGTPLVISFVGYKTETVKAANDMTVYLQPTTEMLDQLVVVGYGTQKRANLTGAVATVDVARTMDSRPVTDVAKALQGAVPGLTITNASGAIADNPTINIRGTGTLSNGHNSSPLIVVDGVVVDDLSYVNAEDIETISVLKDASSSAIYGSRAAFGVILITTKKADTKEMVSVKYNANFGWGKATVLPEFNTTVDNLLLAMDNTNPGGDKEIFNMYYDELLPFAKAWQQQHGGKRYTSLVELQQFQNWNNVGDFYCPEAGNMAMPAGLDGWDYNAAFKSGRWLSYADWDVAKTLFDNAFTQKHNVSLEGRSGRTNYRVSFGYDSREGLWRYNPDKFKRYMANTSIETQIFKFLKAGARVNFSQREYVSPHTSQRNPYQYVWRFPSQFENYGYLITEDGEKMGFRNEISYRMGAHNGNTTTTQTRLQAYMIADLLPGLQLQADFTYQIRDMISTDARIPFTMYSQWVSGTATPSKWTSYAQGATYAAESTSRDKLWTTNVFGTYTKSFGDNNIKVMLGWTAEREQYHYVYVQRMGLLDYTLPNINLTNGDTYSTSGSIWNRATTGFFGRINYDYKGIYLLEVNGRYDGSSRFPAHDQWAFFPSFSAGYRFSEENYFKGLQSWWSNGKIRASYGHVGNESVGSNMFISTISTSATTNWVNGTNKLTIAGMPTLVSKSLTWERIETTDVGVDLGFMKNSLNVSFDWFNRETKDMMGLGQQLPNTLGALSPRSNNGTLRSRGWELSVNWNHSFGDWDVYATFNMGDARSKITKWNNATGLIYSYDQAMNASTGSSYFTPDTYYGDIWGFETQGYFEQGDMTWDANKKIYVPNEGVANQSALESGTFHYGPGDIRFVDQNGDGVINWGNSTMIELNGKTYVQGDAGYDDAKANPNSVAVPVRSLKNHGDLKVIGNALPRYEYSFHLGGAWKGFDLDLFFQGVGKRDMWATGSTIVPMVQSGYGTFTNQLSYNKIVYASDGQIDFAQSNISQGNTYPRMFSGSDGTGRISNIGQGKFNFYPQTKYLTSLAYLRLKNLTFGYTLPTSITQKAWIQRARVYFSADNLCFLHNGAGKYQLDPEMNSSANLTNQGGNGGQGTYGRTVPLQQVFSFGLQVSF